MEEWLAGLKVDDPVTVDRPIGGLIDSFVSEATDLFVVVDHAQYWRSNGHGFTNQFRLFPDRDTATHHIRVWHLEHTDWVNMSVDRVKVIYAEVHLGANP